MEETLSRLAKIRERFAAVSKLKDRFRKWRKPIRIPRRNVLYGLGLCAIAGSLGIMLFMQSPSEPKEEELNWDEFTSVSTSDGQGVPANDPTTASAPSSYLANLDDLMVPPDIHTGEQSSGLSAPGLNPLSAPLRLNPEDDSETQSVSYQPPQHTPASPYSSSVRMESTRGAWLTGTIEFVSESPSAVNIQNSYPIFP